MATDPRDFSDAAERNEPFIRDFLETIGSVLHIHISGGGAVPKYGGLYMFYVKLEPDSEVRYPIYVGMTRRTFRERFREHGGDGGVIHAVENNVFPKNFKDLELYACLVPMDGITSKFVESILLEAFDFCLNSDENGKMRQELVVTDQFRPEDSKADFEISWSNITGKVKELDGLFHSRYK